MMDEIRITLQMVCALGILNVWLLRFNRATPYRGGSARNMKEEFNTYSLPPVILYVVGTAKVLLALGLISGIWFPQLIRPAAIGLASLMIVAVLMHFKIRDPLKKSLPAVSVLVMTSTVALL